MLKALASQHLLHALPRATRSGLGLGLGLTLTQTPTPAPIQTQTQTQTQTPALPPTQTLTLTPIPAPTLTPSSEARLSKARNSLVSNRRLRDVGAAMGVAPLLLPDKVSE